MKKAVLAIILGILFFFPAHSFAMTAAEEQAKIVQLLGIIAQLQAQINAILASQNTCITLTHDLYINKTDATTGGEVSKLQTFLVKKGYLVIPAGVAKGQFGPATQTAVQKFQSYYGIVYHGTPFTTGYGKVGVSTRAKIKTVSCAPTPPPTVPTTPTTPTTPPPTPLAPAGALTISCSAAPTAIGVGQSVTWTSVVTGGTTPYTYSWTGTNSLSGNTVSIVKTYTGTGTKTAKVTVNGVQKDCSNSVVVTQTPPTPQPLSVTCSPSTQTVNTGENVTWSSSISGGSSPYTYLWSGSESLSGSNSSVTKQYSTTGSKNATIRVNGTNFPCSAQVQVNQAQSGTPIAWPPTGAVSKKIHTYVYSDNLSISNGFPNLTGMFWVGQYGNVYGETVGQAVAKALTDSSALPTGHKAMRNYNLSNFLFFFHDPVTDQWPDMCVDPATGQPRILHINLTDFTAGLLPHVSNGSSHAGIVDAPMPCLTWDHGKEFTQDWYRSFFNQFKAGGGKVDLIVNDLEAYQFMTWDNLRGTQLWCDSVGPEVCPVSWCQAIVEDPGFANADFPSNIDLVNDICKSSFTIKHLEYDTWLMSKMAEIEQESVFDIAQSYFPAVEGSSYSNYHWDNNYNVPFGSSPYFLVGQGSQVGTHQGPWFYGNLHSASALANNPPYGPGIPNYSSNAFNAFRFDVNWARSAALSDSAGLHSWITEKVPHSMIGNTPLSSSDLYQEMLIHVGMTNTESFLYWSGFQNPPTDQKQIINDVMGELNTMIGYDGTDTIIPENDIASWNQSYMYTGKQVGSYKVWRFTSTAGSSAVQSVGNSSATLPVVLKTGNGSHTVTFPNATIYSPSTPPVAPAGFWVIQAPNASAPFES